MCLLAYIHQTVKHTIETFAFSPSDLTSIRAFGFKASNELLQCLKTQYVVAKFQFSWQAIFYRIAENRHFLNHSQTQYIVGCYPFFAFFTFFAAQ